MTTRYETLMTTVARDGIVLLDGGVSTELERRGVPMKDEVWSGHASIDAWDTLVATHRAYIDAGSNVITANTYATSRLVLEPTGDGDRVREINLRSLEAAQTARARSGAGDVLIAGSMSHVLPFASGAEGATQQPAIPAETLRAAYDEMVALHEEGGADLLLLEMMSLPGRMLPLFESASQSRLPVWCGLAARRATKDGPITAWHDETVAFADNVAMAARQGFDAIGVMHTTADLIGDALAVVRTRHAGPTMAYPDSGFFQSPHWRFVDVLTPAEFRRFVRGWIDGGVRIVGGCCGLGPEHIAAIADLRG